GEGAHFLGEGDHWHGCSPGRRRVGTLNPPAVLPRIPWAWAAGPSPAGTRSEATIAAGWPAWKSCRPAGWTTGWTARPATPASPGGTSPRPCLPAPAPAQGQRGGTRATKTDGPAGRRATRTRRRAWHCGR